MKKALEDFLKGKGASEEELQQFNQVYDEQIATGIKEEVNRGVVEEAQKQAEFHKTASKLAEQTNIRY
jgi:hypothetical protein